MQYRKILLTFMVVILCFFLMIVSGCNTDASVITDPIEPEEIIEEEQIKLSEEDFTFEIGTLPYRGAVLFINYEGEIDLSDYNLFFDVISDGEIKQEKMAVEEVDGNLVATIVDLMYLPGDELDFVITIQSNSGEELECRYSEILKRYPWKDWMLADNEPFFINSSIHDSRVIKDFHYDYQPWRIVGFHPSWDIWTTPGKEVEVYSGTIGIVFTKLRHLSYFSQEFIEIYNPYVGAIILYGHVLPVGGWYYSDEIYTGKKVFAGDHIANVIPNDRHIHYSIVRPYEYFRRGLRDEWHGYYWPVLRHNYKYIYIDSYNDPFYFHEPTTLGYWYEETLPEGLKEEMLRMFIRDNPDVVLPAREPLVPLD